MRLIGLDPGLRHTGWGMIETSGNRLKHLADGVVHSDGSRPLAERLVALFRQLGAILDRFQPEEAAIEETFVNKNPASTLKLGVARGVVLLAPAERGIRVAEYSANLIKKSVVGAGHADKAQIQMMVRRLLPGCELASPDAADALAVAICHAHHAATQRVWGASPPSAVSPLSPARRGQGEGVGPLPGSRIKNIEHGRATPSPRGGEGAAGVEERHPHALAKRKPTLRETARARSLRGDQTEMERRVWNQIRAHRLDGAKFRRQEPILGFTVDFVCHEHRLIIELDGGQPDGSPTDERRSAILRQAGFQVLRFWNNDVADNIEGVVARIRAALAGVPA